mmetsp:Transcript_10722/g.35936  ORF Transcript_10722/g.35936 Transcript_10722/m.35936 type:complete len:331 (+) Transcript_10722:642-1634(+)
MAVRARGISGADIEGGGAGRAFKAYGGSEFLQEEEFLVSDSKKQSIQTTAAERTRVPREFSEKVEAVKEIQALVRRFFLLQLYPWYYMARLSLYAPVASTHKRMSRLERQSHMIASQSISSNISILPWCMCWKTLEPQFHLDKSSTRQMRRILQDFSAVNVRPPALPLSSFPPGPLRRLSSKGRQPDPAATERRAGREVPNRAVGSLQPVRHVSVHEGRVRARTRVLLQGPGHDQHQEQLHKVLSQVRDLRLDLRPRRVLPVVPGEARASALDGLEGLSAGHPLQRPGGQPAARDPARAQSQQDRHRHQVGLPRPHRPHEVKVRPQGPRA